MDFELRQATEADRELLWAILDQALSRYVVATFGSTRAEMREFFDQRFQIEKHQIVLVAGEDAGYLMFEERSDHVYLGNIALLPGFQRSGIGAPLVRHVIERANARGLPVRLQVLESNPARRFYTRLGFELVGQTESHLLMERPADV